MMSKHIKLAILEGVTLLLLFFGLNSPVSAQNKPTVIDSVTFAFMPAIAYNSDLGLIGGGIFSRYQYKQNQWPFYSYLHASALASTKGLISASLLFDKPHAFNSNIRIISDTYISRFLQNQYYGIANYQKLAEEPADKPDYYLFKSFSTGFEQTFRRPLYINKQGNYLDALGILIFDYQTPWGNKNDRLIAQQQPLGYQGGRTSALGTGFIWEGRDSEFAPTKGIYLKSTAEFGRDIFGSSYNYLKLQNDARAYLSFFLIRKITFANRIFFQHTSGSVPYWKLAELGGEETMRGYPQNRFLDDNALSLNSELRTWLFEFPTYDIRLGGTIFMDMGRTFDNDTAFNSVIKDLKYTYGFGGTGSFFSPDFILRADIGFSDEGYGIYFTAGYMY